MNGEQNQSTANNISVNRGIVDSINIYEITESELETLESATPTGIFFDFGIICLTVAISFTISLLTTTIESERTYTTFLIITVIGYIAFIAFIIFWLLMRKSVINVTKKIRERINPIKNTKNDSTSTE